MADCNRNVGVYCTKQWALPSPLQFIPQLDSGLLRDTRPRLLYVSVFSCLRLLGVLKAIWLLDGNFHNGAGNSEGAPRLLGVELSIKVFYHYNISSRKSIISDD